MKKQEKLIIDDQRTIADMNVEGMPWYLGGKKKNKPIEKIPLTKKERKAVVLGVMSAIMPIFLIYGGIFFLIYLLMDLIWLS